MVLQVSEEHMLDKHPEMASPVVKSEEKMLDKNPEMASPAPSRVSLPELEDELAPISDEETRSVIKVEEFMDKMLSIILITGSSLV